jgi:hypothetical protein
VGQCHISTAAHDAPSCSESPRYRSAVSRSQPLRCALAVSICLGIFAAVSPAYSQQGIAINREYAIKAAFLYHFLTYINWPEATLADPQQPFVIGVYHEDPFGAVLDKIAETKQVEGRPIEIRRLKSNDQLLECHILFLPRNVPTPDRTTVLAAVVNSHVLTVGETDDFIDQGGSAQFFVEGNKIRFAFNTDAVSRSELKISSKLLSIAKVVTNSTK